MHSQKYCFACGAEIHELTEICPKCGVRQPGIKCVSGKSGIVTLLLCLFLGVFGIHRFFVGKTGSGIAQLILSILTASIGGIIWATIDLIMILCGSFEDKNGDVIKI